MSRTWCHDCQGDPFIAKSYGKEDTQEQPIEHLLIADRKNDNARTIGLSLSYHLRHNGTLPIARTGFILVQELMRRTNLVKFRTEDIIGIARNNDRFEVQERGGECRIRAIYGHSINVSELYKEQRVRVVP